MILLARVSTKLFVAGRTGKCVLNERLDEANSALHSANSSLNLSLKSQSRRNGEVFVEASLLDQLEILKKTQTFA